MARVAKKTTENASAATTEKAVKSTSVQKKSVSKAKPAAKTAAKKTVKPPVAVGKSVLTATEVTPEEKLEAGKPLQKNILTPEKKEKYRQLLLKERERFQSVQAYHREHALRSRKDVIDSNSTIMTHMADAGSDVFQQTFNLNMLTNENDVLEMVDEALDRLEEDHYGVCLLCGKLIPEARLEAKPYARLCVKCKSHVEQMESPESRHR